MLSLYIVDVKILHKAEVESSLVHGHSQLAIG